jgi:hypothetical protein
MLKEQKKQKEGHVEMLAITVKTLIDHVTTHSK